MNNSPLAVSLKNLTVITSLAYKIGFAKSISIPPIVIFGFKHTGKSSVVERLIGFDFLPKGYVLISPIFRELIYKQLSFSSIMMLNLPPLKSKLSELLSKIINQKDIKTLIKFNSK